jgi:hypothetical protein
LKELLRTNDPIRLSWLIALLAGEGIEATVLDMHTSIVEGSIGAIPRRLMVRAADAARAQRVLADAGEAVDGD